MIKKLLLPILIIFIVFSGSSQELPEIDGKYKIDTLLKESKEFPGVYDTVIVYKKINIVHKELVVLDSNFTPVITSWTIGLQGGFSPSISSKALPNITSSQTITNIDASVSGNHNNFGFGLLFGVEKRQGKQNITRENMEVHTRNKTITDTVDTYYVNHSNGSQTPVYVTKERNIEEKDTSFTSSKITNAYTLHYASLGLNLTCGFKMSKWELLGLIKYKLGLVLNAKGSLFDNNGNSYEMATKPLAKIQHRGGLGMRVAYHFHSKTALFFNGTYEFDLNTVYTRHDFIGLNLGLLVKI